jgi:hypothetical protein
MHGFYTRAELEQIANQIIGERLPGQPEQLITEVSATQRFALGAVKDIGLSRYRYGQAGAVNIALGVLCQSPVPAVAQHDLVPLASYAVGTKVVGLTIGAANIAANEYAGGWLHVNDGTGQGQCLRILSHPAALAGATCLFTLIDPITTAFDVANTLCALTANPYDGAIIHPSPPTAKLVGVPVVAINANLYGWFKTRGPAAVLTDGTLYIYQQVRPSATVDGAVAHAIQQATTGSTAVAAMDAGKTGALAEDSAGAETVVRLGETAVDTSYDLGSLQTIVGRVMRVEADTDYSLIDLCLE